MFSDSFPLDEFTSRQPRGNQILAVPFPSIPHLNQSNEKAKGVVNNNAKGKMTTSDSIHQIRRPAGSIIIVVVR